MEKAIDRRHGGRIEPEVVVAVMAEAIGIKAAETAAGLFVFDQLPGRGPDSAERERVGIRRVPIAAAGLGIDPHGMVEDEGLGLQDVFTAIAVQDGRAPEAGDGDDEQDRRKSECP